MFSFLRKESGAVQLYGKLPIAKDYLRVGFSAGSARGLRRWMDEAFSTGADEKNLPEPTWPMRFLLGASAGPPLQGCIFPSSDTGGLRLFPVAVAIERQKRSLLTEWKEDHGRSAAVWQELGAVLLRVGTYADGQEFLSAVRGQEVAPHAVTPLDPPAVDAETWARALWPDAGIEGLARPFEELRAHRSRGAREPLRLPLVSNASALAQARAWWMLLVEARIVPAGSAPTLFFPHTETNRGRRAFLTVFTGPLRVSDAAWLMLNAEPAGPGDLLQPEPVLAGPPPSSPASPLAEALVRAWRAQGG